MIEYNNKEWLKLFFTFKGSVIRSILPRVLLCGFFAAIVQLINVYIVPLNSVAAIPWQLVGLALGLLLVFRTNTAYERYWEGRRMWGSVTSATRNFALATFAYLKPSHPDIVIVRQRLIKLLAAYPILMKQRLRNEKDLSEIAELISETDYQQLEQSKHLPFTLQILIAQTLHQAYQKEMIIPEQLRICDTSLTEMTSALGACERIKNTPLPIAYVLHLKRFLYLFCLSLPFPLVGSFGWWTVLIAALFGYAFIGIEEIGIEIEDPFGRDPNDLPLDQMCDTNRALLLDTLKKQMV
jgi:putative membrane protein